MSRALSKEWATSLGVLGTAAIVGYTVMSLSLGAEFAVPTAVILAVGGTVALRGPLGKALARRLEADAPRPVDEATLAELDDLRHRLVELEERQDFTERVLAQRPEPGRLAAPHQESR